MDTNLEKFSLHLEGSWVDVSSCRTLKSTLDTCTVLLLIEFCEQYDIQVIFHPPTSQGFNFTLECDTKTIQSAESSTVVSNCSFPYMKRNDDVLLYCGLGAVLRLLVKLAHDENPSKNLNTLLGFKGICLQSCAETSAWTRFCEIDLLDAITHQIMNNMDKNPTIPECLMKFENQLAAPPVIANYKNKVKQNRKKAGSDCSASFDASHNHLSHINEQVAMVSIATPIPDRTSELRYAEGLSITIADLAIFPAASLILNEWKAHLPTIEDYLPNFIKWFKLVSSHEEIKRAVTVLGLPAVQFPTRRVLGVSHAQLIVPSGVKESLNGPIRDPNRKKFKASEEHVIETIELLKSHGIEPSEAPCSEDDITIPWEGLPRALHPCDGDLPLSRAKRKCEQIENIVAGVGVVVNKGDIIVDFCSGGGHVGIVLAYLFPKCKVVMVENKEASISRAYDRIKKLQLTNVELYKSNLDYYRGRFDVGVCLHACGVATDLVLQACIQNQASFVICPCCYGSIRSTHTMQYPRSQSLLDTHISYKSYLTLGHAADQTQSSIRQAKQGKKCMLLIDKDRCKFAEENGYKVTLTSLRPLNCSPKNDLLIGTMCKPVRTEDLTSE